MRANGIKKIMKERTIHFTNSQEIKKEEKGIHIIILTKLRKEKNSISKHLQGKKKLEPKEVVSHRIREIIMKHKKSGSLQIRNTDAEVAG
jgi:hypothetical protein